MKIGLIGFGVLGRAINAAMRAHSDSPVIYDKYLEKYQDPSPLKDTYLTFVQVPTPTDIKTGLQELEALEDVCSVLQKMNYHGIVVIRSTVLPGTMSHLSGKYKLDLVHNPEFLTEKNAALDFQFQKVVLLSGKLKSCDVVTRFYYKYTCASKFNIETEYKLTEMAKLAHNLILASKLMIANEFQAACAKEGIEWKEVSGLASSIGKIGESHLQVPGPDGKFGFGGMCFVKDLAAFVTKYSGIADILFFIHRKNRTLRPDAYNGKEKTGLILEFKPPTRKGHL